MNTLVINGLSKYDTIWEMSCTDAAQLEYAYRGTFSQYISYIRMLWVKKKLPFENIWYKRINYSQYDIVIVFDANISLGLLQYIKNRAKSRVILYYWNLCRNIDLLRRAKDIGIEVWGFDAQDCKKFSLKYNPQFFFHSWYSEIDCNKDATCDVTFIGRDKGNRMKDVLEIVDSLQKQGACVRTYFVPAKWYMLRGNSNYQRMLNYKEMIRYEIQGKCVLDYNIGKQQGLSLRVFDAINNCRKVITNNVDIVNYSFYCKNNVFIIGVDDFRQIDEFINSSFDNRYKDAILEYDFSNWLERFYAN